MQEIGAINKKQMVFLYDEYLNEIGVMIGGWCKWAGKLLEEEVFLEKNKKNNLCIYIWMNRTI